MLTITRMPDSGAVSPSVIRAQLVAGHTPRTPPTESHSQINTADQISLSLTHIQISPHTLPHTQLSHPPTLPPSLPPILFLPTHSRPTHCTFAPGSAAAPAQPQSTGASAGAVGTRPRQARGAKVSAGHWIPPPPPVQPATSSAILQSIEKPSARSGNSMSPAPPPWGPT